MVYVVTGATGKVGSAVIEYLISMSVPIRAVIRSISKAESFKKQNIEVAIAELNDSNALTEAFQGAHAVFVMNPPAYENSDMHKVALDVSQAMAVAIKANKVPRVIVLSSVGSERDSKTGNILTTHILEETLKNIAPQVVMLRCASFMENWSHAIMAVKLGQSPVLGSMFNHLDRKVPHIAINDIGQVAAEYMTNKELEKNSNLIVELEGPEAYSPNDVARTVSDILGKNVVVVAMSDSIIREVCRKSQWSEHTAEQWIEMMHGFDDGTICWLDDNTTVRRQGKRTLSDVVKEILQS